MSNFFVLIFPVLRYNISINKNLHLWNDVVYSFFILYDDAKKIPTIILLGNWLKVQYYF
jgi:hypothetical protein